MSAGMLGRSQTTILHDHKGSLMANKHILYNTPPSLLTSTGLEQDLG